MFAEPLILESPRWPKQAERRLRVSLLLSTTCVLTVVTVLRFPVVEQSVPVGELLVRILVDGVASAVTRSATEPVDEAMVDETIVDETIVAAPPKRSPVRGKRAEPQDWRAMIPEAAREALDNAPRQYLVNPLFDEKRRHAKAQFAPGKARSDTPIWENVEKDALGRSVLWSGDCYRVIDDPNAGSREAFETFGQYIVMCMNWKDSPKELPWVNEIRNRRASRVRSVPPIVE